MSEAVLKQNVVSGFHAKDPISALTHAIGFFAAIFLTPVLLTHAASEGAGFMSMVSLSIFMVSMVLLYGASTAYHTFRLSEEGVKRLKKLDHSMIFVLIAGSYTPICTIALSHETGRNMLLLVWGIAAAGIIFKMFWVTCPKWVSSVIYIAMGWICVFAFSEIYSSLSLSNFLWLLAGGIAYTVGGVIYGLQKVIAKNKGEKAAVNGLKGIDSEKTNPAFGPHEVFHVFVMIGTACHFIVMYNII